MEDLNIYVQDILFDKKHIELQFMQAKTYDSDDSTDDYYVLENDYLYGTLYITPETDVFIEVIHRHMFVNRLLERITVERDYNCVLIKHNIFFEFTDGVIMIPVYFNPENSKNTIEFELKYNKVS